jgi:selenocysteine lyase/cysteine desulfurase
VQSTQLYLDTARLGRMSGRAQQAHLDFTRLAGAEGGSLFFEQFLQHGSESWSDSVQSTFPGLACWQGVASLKRNLRTLAGSDPKLPVLMVNRLTQLMRFAARLLFQTCRNILVTDLGWPPYRDILEAEARRAGRLVTCLDVRELICKGHTTEDELIGAIQNRFLQTDCDGLFLTAVSHMGFRLPVERVVRTLEAARELRLVIVDGAQDFCHVSDDLNNGYCDLYLAGCHKWLQGFHPMGLGFYGRNCSRRLIEILMSHLLSTGELDDPLLRFTSQLEATVLDGETETVNLIPLFTCQGAATDALARTASLSGMLELRRQNVVQVATMAESCGWRPVLAAEPFRTGILILQAGRAAIQQRSPLELRRTFADKGVALTAYEGGMVRLSVPDTEWRDTDIDQLRRALRSAVA